METQTYLFQSYHLSDKFSLRHLEALFQTAPVAADLTRAAFKNKTGEGYFFIFNFGTICFFNTSKDEQKQIADLLATRYTLIAHAGQWDDFTLEVVPTKKSIVHVGFNKVTLNANSFERVDIIALILAESVTFDYFEALVDDLLEKSNVNSETLIRKGRLPGTARSINRSIGVAMGTKQMILSNLYLLDKPDVVWDDEPLEKLYRGMFRVFEMRERFLGIEFKLRTLQDSMALIGTLLNNRKTENLEIIIVILIIIEICLFGYELFFR